MSQLQATVRGYMEAAAEELNMLVRRSDGGWEADAWHTLYNIVCTESELVADVSIPAMIRYSQAVKLLEKYLEEHEHPERTVVLYWSISFDLLESRDTMKRMQNYRTGAWRLSRRRRHQDLSIRLSDVSFMRTEAALITAAVKVCSDYRDKIADVAKRISFQQAQAVILIEEFLEDERDMLYDPGEEQWMGYTYTQLMMHLRRERMQMRSAGPFAVRFYADILGMLMDYLNDNPQIALYQKLRKFVAHDLKKLEKMPVNLLPFTDYEQQMLEDAKVRCRMHLEIIKKRLGAT